MRLRSVFLVGCIVLALPGLAAAGFGAVHAWESYLAAQAAARGTVAAGEVLRAAATLASERGYYQEAAFSAAARTPALAQAVTMTDEALTRAEGALQEAGLPSAAVERTRVNLSAARERAASAAQKGSVARVPLQQFNQLVEALDEEVSRLERGVTLASPSVGIVVGLARNASELREIAGRRGVLLNTWFSGEPLEAVQRDELQALNGRLAGAWNRLQIGIHSANLPPAVTNALSVTGSSFFVQEEPWYRELVKAAVVDGERPLNFAHYRVWHAAALRTLLPVRDALIAEAGIEGSAASGAARRDLLASFELAAVSLGLVGAAVLALLRRLVEPVRSMTATMTALAAGDTAAPATTISSLREIGAMAAAVAVFRENVVSLHQREAELRQAGRLLETALSNMAQGLCMFDAEHRLEIFNERFCSIYSIDPGRMRPGLTFGEVIQLSAAGGSRPSGAAEETASEEPDWRRWIQPGTVLQELEDGRFISITLNKLESGAWLATYDDITERRAAEARSAAQLREANYRFMAAIENMSQGLAMYDADERLAVVNSRFHEVLGLPSERIQIGMVYREIIALCVEAGYFPGMTAEQVYTTRQVRPIDGVGDVQQGELVGQRIISRRSVLMAGGGWVSTFEDVTERREVETRIAYMARHDALTGLPNRVLLREHMEQVLARSCRDGNAAVLCLDLDGFKAVNDTLGHPAGDELLRLVGRRLTEVTRDTDLVARLGGDEFAIIQSDVQQPEEAAALAQRLVEVLRLPFDLGGQLATIGTSVGIALAGQAGTTIDELLRSADIALYRAKATGRGCWMLFKPDMDAELQRRHRLEADLRCALAESQLEVFYQPLVEARTETLVGFEALLRWRHPERGMVSPAEFIPLAEETGLIRPIGAWVLARACADAASWPNSLKVAVNLSPIQFTGAGLVGEVEQALRGAGLAPHRLELEITESVLLQENDAILRMLHRLRDLGVRISMDDFGTGYSSLSYLRRFPFDKIKVDQSFVRNLERDKGTVAIVRAVVSLGRALGMSVLAEGVETKEQLKLLRDEGCDELQGYLFSKPQPIQHVPALIASYSAAGPRSPTGPVLVINNEERQAQNVGRIA